MPQKGRKEEEKEQGKQDDNLHSQKAPKRALRKDRHKSLTLRGGVEGKWYEEVRRYV